MGGRDGNKGTHETEVSMSQGMEGMYWSTLLSTITNVHPSVCLSVSQSVHQQKPSTAWNHHPSSFFILHLSFPHLATFKLFSLLSVIFETAILTAKKRISMALIIEHMCVQPGHMYVQPGHMYVRCSTWTYVCPRGYLNLEKTKLQKIQNWKDIHRGESIL